MTSPQESRWAGYQLLVAAMGGDERALIALIDAAHPHVQRFARTLCGSPSDSEEAAQEALIILFQRLGSLRAIGALSTLVFRIVRNECIRLARRQLRRHRLLEQLPPLPSAETDVLRKLELDRIARAIAGLPDDQRRVLVLRDVYGHSGHSASPWSPCRPSARRCWGCWSSASSPCAAARCAGSWAWRRPSARAACAGTVRATHVRLHPRAARPPTDAARHRARSQADHPSRWLAGMVGRLTFWRSADGFERPTRAVAS